VLTSHVQEHDWFTNVLTAGLIYGLVVSYLPQHLRIIKLGSSEGFSPWFLLLGGTSSAASMLNMVTASWPTMQCCNQLSAGKCIEITAGVFQVALQWALFMVITVLYMMYFPQRQKYVELDIDSYDGVPPQHVKTPIKSSEWRLSIVLAWVTVVHLLFSIFVTFVLVGTTKIDPDGQMHSRQIDLWETFLGVSSAILAMVQYFPQFWRTYRVKLVGALSIPMLVMQCPGGLVFAISVARRPGTNWTTWVMYAMSSLMQFLLLSMCITWKIRQRKLGIDDFGKPLPGTEGDEDSEVVIATAEDVHLSSSITVDVEGEETPLLPKDVGKPAARFSLPRFFRR